VGSKWFKYYRYLSKQPVFFQFSDDEYIGFGRLTVLNLNPAVIFSEPVYHQLLLEIQFPEFRGKTLHAIVHGLGLSALPHWDKVPRNIAERILKLDWEGVDSTAWPANSPHAFIYQKLMQAYASG
jgi:hypothetical protein